MISQVFKTCAAQLEHVAEAEAESILAAAELVAEAIAGEQGFYLFGSGHSAFIARDAYWRAGGLAPAQVILDPLMGDGERLEGVAAALLGHYDLSTGGVMVIISNSGINHLPVEMCMLAQASGLKVVAITCREHSTRVPARHPSKKKLMDLADVVIDTHGIPGDASLPLPGTELYVAPTSTVIGAAIIQAITAQAAKFLLERGFPPPIIVSVNVPEGDARNQALASRYRSHLVRYDVPTVDAGSRK